MEADGGGGFGLDIEREAGGEADGAEEAEVVFGEAGGGVADGADEFVVEVVAAVDEVEDLVGAGIEEEAVDGEVAAGGVAGGVCFELDGLGMAAVGVRSIGAEGGDFDAMEEDDAEVGADGFGAGEELGEFGGAGRGGDVEVFGLAAEEEVADAAADEESGVSGGVEGVEDMGRGGGGDHLPLYRAANSALSWSL